MNTMMLPSTMGLISHVSTVFTNLHSQAHVSHRHCRVSAVLVRLFSANTMLLQLIKQYNTMYVIIGVVQVFRYDKHKYCE